MLPDQKTLIPYWRLWCRTPYTKLLTSCLVLVVVLSTNRQSWSVHHDAHSITPSTALTGAAKFESYARASPPVQVNPENLKSQSQEDVQLLQWFGALTNGTYLEIGGLDGITFSNTYAFNKDLGWRGVLIELSSDNYNNLVKNRPNEIANIHAGVCGEKRTLHYVEGRLNVGGIWEFAAQTFKDQWWPGVNLQSPEVKLVECAPLNELLEPHVGETFYFDFFSLDVEGAELEVLRSIDFSKFGFGIILAEADSHNQLKNLELRMLLETKGYSFLMDHVRSFWFVNKAFSEIYRDKYFVA